MAKPIQNAVVTWRQDLNDTLSIFRFDLEGGVPDYRPGQFLTIGMPIPSDGGKVSWRAYSIASPPSQKEYLELYIRRPLTPVPGKLTTELWSLPVGGTIQHRGITGPFTIEEKRPDGSPDTRRLLLVGGGTGVAPFIAFALELWHRKTPRELILLHGASYVDELAYRDLLLRLQEETASAKPGEYRLRYFASISRPQDPKNAGWTGETGRIEQLLEPIDGGRSRIETLLDADVTPQDFYCHVCGYDGTVKAALGVLEPRDFRTLRKKREDGSTDMKFESYG